MVPANFSCPSQGQGQGQMSNTNNYCLEFLLTTYDFTIATETVESIHIIMQMFIHKEIMKFRLKFLLGCHGNDDFNFKFYIFTVYNMRISWGKRCLARMQMS